MEGKLGLERLDEFADSGSERYVRMVEWIREDLGLTSLQYQRLPDLVRAIGLSKVKSAPIAGIGKNGAVAVQLQTVRVLNT